MFCKRDLLQNNIFKMFSGSTISQIIWLCVLPVLTRYYSPEEFGIYHIFNLTSTSLVLIATARYDQAVIVPRFKSRAVQLMVLSLCCASVFSFALLLLLWVLSFFHSIASLASDSNWRIVFFIPLYTLILAGFDTLYIWQVREQHYNIVSSALCVFPIMNFILNMVFLYGGDIEHALIKSSIIARGIELLYLAGAFWYFDKETIKVVSFSRLWDVAIRYSNFPKYSIIGAGIDAIINAVPSYFMAMFFGVKVTGFFSLAVQSVSMPGSLVAKSMGDVFRQQSSYIYQRHKECRDYYKKNLKILIKLAGILFVGIIMFAPFLFSFVYGEVWSQSGYYAQLISLMVCSNLVRAPLNAIYVVAEKQDVYLKIQWGRLMLLMFAIFIGGWYANHVDCMVVLMSLVLFFCDVVTIKRGVRISEGWNRVTLE